MRIKQLSSLDLISLGGAQIEDIPLWIRTIYGFLEISVITMFLTTWLNLGLTWKRKLVISLGVLFCVLSARILLQNLFFVTGAGVVSFYLLLFFLTRARGLKVIISILATYMVLIIVEPITHLMSLKLLHELDYLHIWLISGFPNILVFILLTYLLIKVRQNNEKSEHKAL